jgi:putative iron-regulated protein
MLRRRLNAWPVAAFATGLCLTISPALAEPTPKDVLTTYVDMAEAGYTDSLDTARTLKLAVDALLAKPTEDNLRSARAAWIAARIPYMQTEAFRFGNSIVDDWQGRVNSWPLDEGLIDYVAPSYGTESAENELYLANVIANKTLTIGGKKLDTSKITKELLADQLQEAGGVEANVATGYHAVEFLLWGQDLNGTGPGNGHRPATDYDTKKCTNGNCARRAQYLSTVTDLLVDDLAFMAAQWGPDGAARKKLMDGKDQDGLVAIMTGLGSLSYGELAGERMKLGLMIHDPEEEHDCFSDNTHASHFFDALGIRNVYEHVLAPELHQLSIRHLAIASGDTVVFGCQYRGPEQDAPPLVGFHRRGETPVIVEASGETQQGLRNYIGSVAADSGGSIVAASAPKGSLITYWDVAARRYLGACDLNDGCGLAPTHRSASFLLTSGDGWLATDNVNGSMDRQASGFQWDNHAILVR